MLVFWYPGGFGRVDGYREQNEIIANYYDKRKFEVYAVTRYPYAQATEALKKSPILNAHHIFDAGDLMDIYSPENRILLIVTDKDHKITYAAEGNAGITPRVLYGLLKGL